MQEWDLIVLERSVFSAAMDPGEFSYRPGWTIPCHEEGLARRHLTLAGDMDAERHRVPADYGYLNGDSTPLLIA